MEHEGAGVTLGESSTRSEDALHDVLGAVVVRRKHSADDERPRADVRCRGREAELRATVERVLDDLPVAKSFEVDDEVREELPRALSEEGRSKRGRETNIQEKRERSNGA